MFATFFWSAVAFALPCWITNASFNLINPFNKKFELVRKLNFPLDFHIMLPDGERLLGGSQQFLSLPLVFGIPCILMFFLKETYLILLLKSVCVFLGDALGSFIKRRLHFKRGEFFVGVDHGDYMLMTSAVFLLLRKVLVPVACLALIITYIFHPIVCYIGYKLQIKDEPC